MAVRIQLASNFQVIELTYDSWEQVNEVELEQATNMVNSLGQTVINDIKTKTPVKEKQEMSTPGQIKYLVSLGVEEEEAQAMTKKEAWQYLQKHSK